MLIIFGGLPRVGKTTLAKAVAREWEAVYLRVGTIEQALRFSEALQGEVGPAGYLVAYRLAEENLRIGLPHKRSKPLFSGVSDLGPTTCMPLGQTFQCLRNCFMPVQTRR